MLIYINHSNNHICINIILKEKETFIISYWWYNDKEECVKKWM